MEVYGGTERYAEGCMRYAEVCGGVCRGTRRGACRGLSLVTIGCP